MHFDFENFFEISPDLLCIAGYDGYFKRINPAVSKLLGYSMEELYARPINDFVHPADKEMTSRARMDLTKSNALYNFENRYLTKSGDTVWLAWTSQPVPGDKLIFAIAKDITHKKRLEIERYALLESLTKGNHDLKKLSLTASHDMRSPLTGLLSAFDLFDVSKIDDQETLELIELLKLAGENLKETLNNYVDVLSEKLSEVAAPEEVNLDNRLQIVLQSIESLIKTSKATIYSDFSGLPQIQFNKVYMESIFLNLITNAIKYAKPEEPPVITIYSKVEEGMKCLIIEDNGQGFDMENVKGKIFGMHQTFHQHKESKGIGLYLVHSHVTSMGGEIRAESEPGKGTRFVISFG